MFIMEPVTDYSTLSLVVQVCNRASDGLFCFIPGCAGL